MFQSCGKVVGNSRQSAAKVRQKTGEVAANLWEKCVESRLKVAVKFPQSVKNCG